MELLEWTRMGFDMVVSRKNMHDVEKILHFCRKNNLWIIFSFFLTAGRSAEEDFDHSLELSAMKSVIKKTWQKDYKNSYNKLIEILLEEEKIYNTFFI